MKTNYSIFVLILLLLPSCNKDYTCNCTTRDANGDVIRVIPEKITEVDKTDAETACNENSYEGNGTETICELSK